MSDVKHVKECFPDIIYTDCSPIISERSVSSFLRHECVIENYSTLKEKTHYSMTHIEEFPRRTLKLYKTKTSHIFQFHCQLTNADIQKMSDWELGDEMECCIAYDEDEVVCPGNLNETNYVFSIEVPIEVIVDPNNKYLHENDKLVIQFRYRNKFYTRDIICRSGKTSQKDEERLSNDLLSLYEGIKFEDFALLDVDGTEHFANKAICKARSEYISNIDDKTVAGVTVNGEYNNLELVIQYMYNGMLPQLPVEDLLKVAEVVEELDVTRLRMSIHQALLESLNKINAVKIRDECIKYPNMHPVSAAAKLLVPIKIKSKRHRR